MDDNFCGGTIVTSSVKGLHANNNHCGSLVGNGIYPRYDYIFTSIVLTLLQDLGSYERVWIDLIK